MSAGANFKGAQINIHNLKNLTLKKLFQFFGLENELFLSKTQTLHQCLEIKLSEICKDKFKINIEPEIHMLY